MAKPKSSSPTPNLSTNEGHEQFLDALVSSIGKNPQAAQDSKTSLAIAPVAAAIDTSQEAETTVQQVVKEVEQSDLATLTDASFPLKANFRETILAYIRERDPEEKVISIDMERKTIAYRGGIKVWASPKYETEGFVRAYLIAKLVFDLKYPPHEIEIERLLDVEVGRKKHKSQASGVSSGRNDVLLFQTTIDQSGASKRSLFMGIECKANEKELVKSIVEDANGQLWGIAKASSIEAEVGKNVKYLCLFACETDGDTITDHARIIDFKENQTFDHWVNAKMPAFSVIPQNYGIASAKIFAKVNAEIIGKDGALREPLNKSLNLEGFVKLRSKLHNRLWAGSSADDNAIFYQLVKLFLAKIYDEATTKPDDDYKFQVLTTHGIEQSAAVVFENIRELYDEACSTLLNYDKSTIANHPLMVQGMTEQKLKVAVQALQHVSITANEGVKAGHDFLGAFFEGILSNQDFFKQSKGCFFTHQNIVRFIVAALEIDGEAKKTLTENPTRPRLPSIIDPSCGSGTFLIEAMKFLTARLHANRHTIQGSDYLSTFLEHNLDVKSKPNIWAKDCLYGVETRPELGLAAKVNMILHGDGNMNVFIQDALHSLGHQSFKKTKGNAHETNNGDSGLLILVDKSEVYGKPVNEQFDFVITNPPFSLETAGLDSKSTHHNSFVHHRKTNSENLFIERHWQLLRPKGRLAAVLPESVFDTSENAYIRLFIYKHFWVDGVVSLPTDAFAPFTTTKTSILLATKKTNLEVQSWNTAWTAAVTEYVNLRKSSVAQAILKNERLMNGNNGLVPMCVDFKISFEPSSPVLDAAIFTDTLRDKLGAAIEALTDAEKEKKKAYRESFESICEFVDVGGLKNHGAPSTTPKPKASRRRKAASETLTPSKLEKIGEPEAVRADGMAALTRLLRRFMPGSAKDVVDVCDRAYDELLMALRLDWEDGDGTVKPYANAWWCFAETVEDIKRPTFYAEVENVGYKRTKRGETPKQNDLFAVAPNGDGFPVPNIAAPATVLDHFIAFKRQNKIN